MPKTIRIYDASLHMLLLTITPATGGFAGKLATKFGLNMIPSHLYRLLAPPPNRQLDESAAPLDLGSNTLYDALENGGMYSIHEKVLNIAFCASPTSPTSHIDLPYPHYSGDLIAHVKEAMLQSYHLARDAPCDIRAVVDVDIQASVAISSSKELQDALAKKWPLQITIDREAKAVPGVEVGIRNLVELAIKMLMVYGDLKSTPTKILKELAFGDQHSPAWMLPIFQHLQMPPFRSEAVWRSLCAAYDDLSSQVLHIQMDQMMPDWDEINESEAVECFSPTRRSIPALHAGATRIAKGIIRFLTERGLNENLVMATFYLRSLARSAEADPGQFFYGTGQLRGEEVLLYLDPQEFVGLSLKRLYLGMAGGDDKLTKWAQLNLLSMYTDEPVSWPAVGDSSKY
ncbi:hypothetical protein HKX48_002263 [Thoreauomyces humboldtii]|nr:hypothetical protein HKX48_002263 [Thoreauomyces humboldtii]